MPEQKKEKKIKNKKALLAGLSTGIITILFLGELFQTLLVFLAGGLNIQLNLSFTGLQCRFVLPQQLHILFSFLVYTAAEIFILLFFEIGIILLKRTGLGFTRFSLIVFEMILIGFLIVDIFYGAIGIVLKMQGNDWANLVNRLGLSFEGGIIFMFFMIIIFIVYINFSSKRIINYINA